MNRGATLAIYRGDPLADARRGVGEHRFDCHRLGLD